MKRININVYVVTKNFNKAVVVVKWIFKQECSN